MESEEIYDDVQSTTYCDFQKTQEYEGETYTGLLKPGARNVYACPVANELSELSSSNYIRHASYR